MMLSVLLCAFAWCGAAVDLSSLFNDSAQFAVGSAYPSGTNPVENFPLLVRVSESRITGFSYARAGWNDPDIRFGYIDGDGTLQDDPLPFEIEKWDTSGESRVWVLVPSLNNNQQFRVVMYWNAKTGVSLPANEPTDVWLDYVAVWHMEKNDAGDVIDATGNGYDIKGVPELTAVDAPLGSGLGFAGTQPQYAKDWSAMFPVAKTNFTFSAWYRVDPSSATDDFRFFDKKAADTDEDGWYFHHAANVPTALDLVLKGTASSDISGVAVSDCTNSWNLVAFDYQEAEDASSKSLALYVNGQNAGNRSNGNLLVANGASLALLVPGLVADEVRVSKSAHKEGYWSKVEYAQATNENFCTVKKVTVGDDSESLEGFHDKVEIQLSDFATRLDGTLTNFAFLVRLAKNEPNGFDPELAGENGAYVRFAYSDAVSGALTVLPSEVDSWDVNGEYSFWVGIPTLGKETIGKNRLYMFWNPRTTATLPAVSPDQVWTDRNAVWHMTDSGNSASNGVTGVLGDNAVETHDAAVGVTWEDDIADGSETLIYSANYETRSAYTTDGLAVSCWMKLTDRNTQGAVLFENVAVVSAEPLDCAVRFAGPDGDATKIAVYPGASDTADGIVFDVGDRLVSGAWERLDVVISPKGWVELRVSGELIGRETFTGAIGMTRFAIESTIATAGFPGVMDELRVATAENADSAVAVTANVYQVKGIVTNDFGYVSRDGRYFNEWVRLPSVSPTMWRADGDVGTFDVGQTLFGESAVLYFIDVDTQETLDAMPTSRGRYKAVVGVRESDDYQAITATVDFRIETGSGTGGITDPDQFDYAVVFTPSNLVYETDLSTNAVLIRVRDGSPSGFSFSKLIFGATVEGFYSDVRFYDESRNALDYVIDRWNTDPTDETGTLIWVKPIGAVTSSTRITMCWGQGANTTLPENETNNVWEATSSTVIDDIRARYLADYDDAVSSGKVCDSRNLQLQNRWITYPSVTPETRKIDEAVQVVERGSTYGGIPTVTYFNRSTGVTLADLPTDTVGEYRAVFKFPATKRWSELSMTIDFRIMKDRDEHDLGDDYDRALLANDDYSVSGGTISYQSYDDDEKGWGLPYWTHHLAGSTESVSDYDFTSTHVDYNLFAGTFHEYMEDNDKTNRLWGLEYVRFGNLFNNGRLYPTERGTEGLRANQNYLPWNPKSQRMLGYLGYEVDDLHRFAGTFLLQNVCGESNEGINAQICSRMYPNGIGTVYFDVVNAFTDNVYDEDGNPSYAIAVEVATNMVELVDGTRRVACDKPPADGPYPDGIWSVNAGSGEVVDHYRYADWQPVELHPILFRADTGTIEDDCEVLSPTNELVLAVTNGASCAHFYRVYVPVNVQTNARFRIRRTRIDTAKSLNPDASWIIVDNVICSRPSQIVDVEPYGWFDSTKRGKQYLGREGAFDPKLPGVSDVVNMKVRATTAGGGELPTDGLTALTMHYRWHYLAQTFGEWQYVDINPTTLETFQPLSLEKYPGDIDFWFEGAQNCGYYSYANYSGTKVGVPGYSEAFSHVTNGWDGVSTAWTSRIRDGKSDLEEMKLFIREPASGGTWRDLELDMELVDNNKWRGYYQTTNALPNGIRFRFEMRNRQTSGFTDWSWNTNVYTYADTIRDLPFTGKLVASDTNGTWATMPVDAETGYLLFQVDDSSLGLSVVHADYQNFNRWTDAWSASSEPLFVGTSKDDADLPTKGVSPQSRIFTRDFTSTAAFVATNWLWNLDFEHSGKNRDWYEQFPAGEKTEVDWALGKGQFVYAGYRDPETGAAFQMAGCSEGYVEFSNSRTTWPRGLESVTFNARIAQPVQYTDFTYYEDGTQLADYTFLSRVAFDLKENRGFTGNASLSLMAYYRREKGCYEARWEQIGGSLDTAGAVGEATARGQRLCIYRWRPVQKGDEKVFEAQLLCCVTNDTGKYAWFDMPKASSLTDKQFMPMMISVKSSGDKTIIVAGVCGTAMGSDDTFSSSDAWNFISYCDGSSDRLVSGTYGVQGASSDGYFITPQFSSSEVITGNSYINTFCKTDGQVFYHRETLTQYLPAATMVDCKTDIDNDRWDFAFGRAVYFANVYPARTVWGIKSDTISQRVNLWMAPASDPDNWSIVKTYGLTNAWGKINVMAEFGGTEPLPRINQDVHIRLRTGGTLNGQRTDVVIDNVTVRQWRGKNEILLYTGSESPDSTNDCRNVSYADPYDFIYTSAWMVKGAALLSAKRTLTGRPCSIRTPLLDGKSGRGQGLGLISFTYRNAQTNVCVLVQVATNVNYTALLSRTTSVEEDDWTTVRTLKWADLAERSSVTVGLGYRNVGNGAVARIIVDPDLVRKVNAVTGATDTSAFGEIEITSVTVQDEPPIDKGCWWGWNLRTLGDADDSELKMFLPDPSMPSPGLSLALNNSTTANIVEEDASLYPKHMPFVQTPSFTNDVIGEVQFRARKYDLSRKSQAAEVTVYGTTLDTIARDEWEVIHRFVVSNTVYGAYSIKTDAAKKYCALRLAVTGVSGVTSSERGDTPVSGPMPVRVLLDEILVSEAIRPRMAFRNVHAFRSDLKGDEVVADAAEKAEQPLCGEGWGVQCEVYAVMLADEIDTSVEPKVTLHWFEGKSPWGYDNWKDLPAAQSGALLRATGTGKDEYFYRSSYANSPSAVIPQSDTAPTVVQYMLEVKYGTIDSETGKTGEATALLSIPEGEWTRPDWLAPVDYNNDPSYGKGKDYACFTILDTLSPGWAWINEVNVFGGYDSDYYNNDRNCQYVEVAAPAAIDVSGWAIRMIAPQVSSKTAVTNVVAIFGEDGLSGVKDKNIESNYVFHVVACPKQDSGDRSILKKADGSLDGTWSFTTQDGTVFRYTEELGYYAAFAVQLVRKSGVVEHEIVAIGTNIWYNIPSYDIDRAVEFMNQVSDPATYFSVGSDNLGSTDSLSVFAGFGENVSRWDGALERTPGRINVGQQINPDVPQANGELVTVVLNLDQTGGNIYQSLDGGASFTNAVQRFYLNRGTLLGTNVTYKVDRWYEVGYVRETNGGVTTNRDLTGLFDYATRELTINIGHAASNGVSVTAGAAIDHRLEDYGLVDGNRYTPAIVKWLQDGKTLKGDFANPDSGELYLSEFWSLNRQLKVPMTLTEMYWLDIDPTVSNMIFQAGIATPPSPKIVEGYEGSASVTNMRMAVFMMISNKTDDVSSEYYGRAWSPYTLRGAAADSVSTNYTAGTSDTWTSVTFKVTGILANGKTGEGNKDDWKCLRWFVFNDDSFYQADEYDAGSRALLHKKFTTEVEVYDPCNSKQSPAYYQGWHDWSVEHPGTPVFYSWGLDDRLSTFEVEQLKPNNYYKDE